MLKKSAEQMVFFFVKKGVIDEEVKEVYIYGSELLISEMICTLLVMGIGLYAGVLCLLRTIFLETTYASCSGSTPASISNFVFLRIFGAFKASPSLSPTLPMKR